MSDLTAFFGPNAGYVLELYDQYQRDPQSVDDETRAFFSVFRPEAPQLPIPAATVTNAHALTRSPLDVDHTVGAARLIRYIREKGHSAASIDPLGAEPQPDGGLKLESHDITNDDLLSLPPNIVRGPLVKGSANAFEAVQKLREVYSSTIGYETDHVQNWEERTWIRDAIEGRTFFYGFDEDRKFNVLDRLTEVEVFETYLHKTFQGQKRFSLEGLDMLVPMMDSIVRNAAAENVREIVIGMAHRGRLNMLAHVLGKPYEQILHEFISAGKSDANEPAGRVALGYVGDVKYHLGARRAYKDMGVSELPITLVPNPSHLEFVNAVVEGRARAAQERRDQPGLPQRDKHASLPVLIHGDAAFPGQGIVAETLNMSNLSGYSTGGTIHIITNNQIGFTTEPIDSRSTVYASDLAKGFEIPIVHVNADDVWACIAVARMAYAYRSHYGKDFVIDLVGYRRWGHNEGDDPSFTQPQMYEKIRAHPTVRSIWAARLEAEGLIPAGHADALVAKMVAKLAEAKDTAEHEFQHADPPADPPPGLARRTVTRVPSELLRAYNEALFTWPAGLTINPRLDKQLQERRASLDVERRIFWGHAEELAFASIVAEGVPIRLSGQDSQRGTFVQRHLVVHDITSSGEYCALHHLPQAKASFAVYNSPLSEQAVLGFEFGYSAHEPNALVLWEAQFGDFANGAQVIIDQFIVSARKKWGQTPALVLLLPHGYEGQGPEHSSAKLERFLQLAADDNMRIANCTTAAQYFHVLRRQALLLKDDPRPLVVMTPKSLLRNPRAGSSLADLTDGKFQRVMDDPTGPARADEIVRLVLCSGKVAVDLAAEQQDVPTPGVAVVRVEELYSFPADELRELFGRYPQMREIVWLQEEPRNMGAWSYIELQLRPILPADIELRYAGRAASASPSEGSLRLHTLEQSRIIAEALSDVPLLSPAHQ